MPLFNGKYNNLPKLNIIKITLYSYICIYVHTSNEPCDLNQKTKYNNK